MQPHRKKRCSRGVLDPLLPERGGSGPLPLGGGRTPLLPLYKMNVQLMSCPLPLSLEQNLFVWTRRSFHIKCRCARVNAITQKCDSFKIWLSRGPHNPQGFHLRNAPENLKTVAVRVVHQHGQKDWRGKPFQTSFRPHCGCESSGQKRTKMFFFIWRSLRFCHLVFLIR